MFFLALAVLGLVSVFAYACRADWETNERENFVFLTFPACGALIATLAMTVAALLRWKRYSPLWLSLWMAVCLVAGWVLIASPFVVFGSVAGGWESWWQGLLYPLLRVASASASDRAHLGLLNFAVVMPFFLLAFLESHFLPAASAGAVASARLCLDKIHSAVDFGMTDDSTGFICWFLKQGRSWAAIWPEIRLRQDMNLHGQSDLRELQAETQVFRQCGIRLLRMCPAFASSTSLRNCSVVTTWSKGTDSMPRFRVDSPASNVASSTQRIL